ncbi:unnamed protein product [Meloidogyne enterolobii]|uniref:Uncharacterized protein n=1 Tax=Meloidogyne enterolobii TaxID=390850 RepID=A0ACB1B9I9_MELEN
MDIYVRVIYHLANYAQGKLWVLGDPSILNYQILERLREKMRLRVKLAGPDADADENEFRKKLDAELDEAERGLLEKDQLVKQLSTQISDLEQYVQLLQREAVTLSCPGILFIIHNI